jgi:hypothetical protein
LRTELRPPSAPTTYLQSHAVVVLPQRLDPRGPGHGLRVRAAQPVQQHAIGQRLDEAVAARPAELAGRRLQACQVAPLAIDEGELLMRHGVGENLVGEAHRLERAQGLVVHADAARVVDEVVARLEHAHRRAVPAEQVGGHQAGRSGAHDRDVHELRARPASGS